MVVKAKHELILRKEFGLLQVLCPTAVQGMEVQTARHTAAVGCRQFLTHSSSVNAHFTGVRIKPDDMSESALVSYLTCSSIQ